MFPMGFFFLGGRLVVDLLNTVGVMDGRVRDLLGTQEAVAAWARAAGIGPRPGGGGHGNGGTPGHLRQRREPAGLHAFRERLRRGLLAWAATGIAPAPLVARLNYYLARDPAVVVLRGRRGKVIEERRSVGSPRARVYGAVARSAAELLTTGDPQRLRKCANPSCRLMFYDVSKGGRRRWCSMQTCGARAKVRAFYRRHRRRS